MELDIVCIKASAIYAELRCGVRGRRDQQLVGEITRKLICRLSWDYKFVLV